ncbi:MAG: indole-3-glycerol phosphate synthase TrpC [Bacteroidales bacterium]|jgi:indole-3-glycerol phosphate synthase
MTILNKIIENKKKELNLLAGMTAVRDLENSRLFKRETISLSEFILDKTKTGIIAEFKRKSPSKGIINSSSSVEEVTSGYFRAGASGVSILTDTQFFGGSNSDLLHAREKSLFPILRKDFIIDEYQVIESKSIGADAILLIAAALEKQIIVNLSQLARSLGLEVLLEIHEQDELDKVNQYVNIIGVNNRNLKTFEVNTDISDKIAEEIPHGFLKISESGISSPQVIKRLRFAGYDGFLIGEKFMYTTDPVNAFSEFVKDLI